MSEKKPQSQPPTPRQGHSPGQKAPGDADKAKGAKREERLASALRENLRRRKAGRRSDKEQKDG